MILTTATAKVVAARVTEAPPFDPAHQALGNHLVKTLPVLLGNEDPGEHRGITDTNSEIGFPENLHSQQNPIREAYQPKTAHNLK